MASLASAFAAALQSMSSQIDEPPASSHVPSLISMNSETPAMDETPTKQRT
jgi:hypothetical protein